MYTDKYLDDNEFSNKYHFTCENESYNILKNLIKEGDVVLFKGSHAMNLGNIVSFLMKCWQLFIINVYYNCITIQIVIQFFEVLKWRKKLR